MKSHHNPRRSVSLKYCAQQSRFTSSPPRWKEVCGARVLQQLLVEALQNEVGIVILGIQLTARRFATVEAPWLLVDAHGQLAHSALGSPIPAIARMCRRIDLGYDLNAIDLGELGHLANILLRVRFALRVSSVHGQLWIVARNVGKTLCICEVPVEAVHLGQAHAHNRTLDGLHREEVARGVQHQASIPELGRILHLAIGIRMQKVIFVVKPYQLL